MAEPSNAHKARADALAASSDLTAKAEAVRAAMAEVNAALVRVLEKFRLASEATWDEMDTARGYPAQVQAKDAAVPPAVDGR